MESLTDKIKRLRKSSGITQIEVATAAGITQSGFAAIEKGNTKSITIEIGVGIAKALGVPFNELFEIEIGNAPKEEVFNQIEDLKGKLEELKERISEKDQLIKAISNQNKQLKSHYLSDVYLDLWREISDLEDKMKISSDEKERQALSSKIAKSREFFDWNLQFLISVGALEQNDIDEFIEFNQRRWKQTSEEISLDQSTPTIQ